MKKQSQRQRRRHAQTQRKKGTKRMNIFCFDTMKVPAAELTPESRQAFIDAVKGLQTEPFTIYSTDGNLAFRIDPKKVTSFGYAGAVQKSQ